MADMKIPLTLTFTKDQLAFIIHEALSHSNDYWYFIGERVEPVKWEYRSDIIRDCDYPLNPGGALLFRKEEDVDKEPDAPTYPLNLKTIRYGLLYMSYHTPHLLAPLVKRNCPNENVEQFMMAALFLSREQPPIANSRLWYCDICGSERDAFTDSCFKLWTIQDPDLKLVCVQCHHGLIKARMIVKEAK